MSRRTRINRHRRRRRPIDGAALPRPEVAQIPNATEQPVDRADEERQWRETWEDK